MDRCSTTVNVTSPGKSKPLGGLSAVMRKYHAAFLEEPASVMELAYSPHLRLSDSSIEAIVEYISEEEIDLRPGKQALRQLLQQTGNMITRQSFEVRLDLLGLSDVSVRASWLSAFDKLTGVESIEIHVDFMPLATIVSLIGKVMRDVRFIDNFIRDHLSQPNQKEAFRLFSQNECIIFACEFLVGRFLHEARSLVKKLEFGKDFSDIRARSIFLEHPVDDLLKELKWYLKYRNGIFHLDNLYDMSFEGEIDRKLKLYSYLEHMIMASYIQKRL